MAASTNILCNRNSRKVAFFFFCIFFAFFYAIFGRFWSLGPLLVTPVHCCFSCPDFVRSLFMLLEGIHENFSKIPTTTMAF